MNLDQIDTLLARIKIHRPYFMKDMKQRIESLEIPKAGENPDETEEFATPIINVVLSTYYKGTALDGVTKKLEEYLDSANPKENDINNL